MFALLLTLSALTSATGDATPTISWATVAGEAGAAFARGPGRAGALEGEGAADAARQAAGRWDELALSAAAEGDATGGEPFEITVEALVSLKLGAGPRARRSAWRARAGAIRARELLSRFRFQGEAIARFGAWWAEARRAEHLEEHAAEFDRSLQPLRDAVAKQLWPRSALEDLEAELARMRAEVSRARLAQRLAAARLGQLLGGPTRPSLGDDPSGQGISRSMDANPWTALVTLAERHPALRALTAEAARERATARVHDTAAPTRLVFGAGVRQVGEGSTFPGVAIGVAVPLENPEAADAVAARARARALEARRRWELDQVRAALAAEVARHDAWRRHLKTIRERLLRPLAARVERFEAAAKTGQATAEQLIRARRDLAEAHHEAIETESALMASAARAEAVRGLLELPTLPEEGR